MRHSRVVFATADAYFAICCRHGSAPPAFSKNLDQSVPCPDDLGGVDGASISSDSVVAAVIASLPSLTQQTKELLNAPSAVIVVSHRGAILAHAESGAVRADGSGGIPSLFSGYRIASNTKVTGVHGRHGCAVARTTAGAASCSPAALPRLTGGVQVFTSTMLFQLRDAALLPQGLDTEASPCTVINGLGIAAFYHHRMLTASSVQADSMARRVFHLYTPVWA